MKDNPIRPALALSLCAMMLLQMFVQLPIPVAKAEGPRAGEFFVWEDHKRIKTAIGGERVGDMAADSEGNLHYVWVNATGKVFYGKTDPNGTFIGSDRIIGNSTRGWAADPKLSLDEGDQVHITWSNNTGPLMKRTYEYVRLTSSGSIVSMKHLTGGDDIIGYSTGFAVLRYYNNTSSLSSSYGPLSLILYDGSGAILRNITVGYHLRDFENAAMVRNSTGQIFIVYMMNETVMNATMVDGMTLPLNQTMLFKNRVQMLSPILSIDIDGRLQLVWIDRIPNAAYEYTGIYHMRLDMVGNVISAVKLLDVAYIHTYLANDLASFDTKGYDDLIVLSKGYYTDMGSGGDELPEYYTLIHITKDGTIISATPEFLAYCSDNTPAMAQSANGMFYMFWGERPCFSESGGSSDPGGLSFRRSLGKHFIDLSVPSDGVGYPTRIFPNETFDISIRVDNLGDWPTTDFVLNVSDKSSGLLIRNATGNLEAKKNMSFQFNISIEAAKTFIIEVDPLENPDNNISNNKIEITLTPLSRPDLSVSSDNITFSNVRPTRGQIIEISAQIWNLGGHGAQANVTFYDWTNGSRIGTRQVNFDTLSTTTSVFWKATSVGLRTILINITDITPAEPAGALGNNHANRTILVGSKTVPSVEIDDPVNGKIIERGIINITGRAWDQDLDQLQMFVRVDGGSWEQVVSRSNSSLAGGYTWFIVWDFVDISLGEHSIMAQVKDDIHENTTVAKVTFVKYLVPFSVVDWSPRYDPIINETESVLFNVLVDNPHGLDIEYQWALDNTVVNTTSNLNITTTFTDAGVFNITVEVYFGNTTWSHKWKLTVIDWNRPPTIQTFTPSNTSVQVRQPSTIEFVVYVTDPDFDVLNYTWTSTGGQLVNVSKGVSKFKFTVDGTFFINVSVSDGKGGKDNKSWVVVVKMERPPCCLPPPDNGHNAFEDLIWILIVVIGIIVMTSIVVLYWRMTRVQAADRKTRKEKGEPEPEDLDEGISPPGRVQ